MTLADHRGKIMLLKFFGDWCGPCREGYPRARAFVKRMQGRPFVLIGVNTDPPSGLRRFLDRVDRGEVNWRSFRDGSPTGPICRLWRVSEFPTTFLIDQDGLIRSRDIPERDWESVVVPLVEEVEAAIRE